jgi:hypothetical protein
MSFQWLDMRISEETDRRQKEAQAIERLPQIMDEVHRAVADCVDAYVEAFGKESIELSYFMHKIRVNVRELKDGKWEKAANVEVTPIPKLPGIHIERAEGVLDIGVGLMPGDRIFYKDGEKFLEMEELTRRILDKSLFPKLGE